MNHIEVEEELIIDEPKYQMWQVKDAETQEVIGFNQIDLEATTE